MEEKTAKKRKKTELIGKGCLIQLIGIILFILSFALGPVGIVLGGILLLALLVMGSRQSIKWTCSNCGTVLLNKKVTECPGCHAHFE